jgi:UDP:flavonoid glycosyltransferase YjiC (YdhE family)
LRAAVLRILDDPSYTRNAQRIASTLARTGGAAQAASLLEGMLDGFGQRRPGLVGHAH